MTMRFFYFMACRERVALLSRRTILAFLLAFLALASGCRGNPTTFWTGSRNRAGLRPIYASSSARRPTPPTAP
jgi:hypothetical protein